MGLSTLRARAPPSPSQASPEQLKSEATQGATSGLKSWPGPRGCALSLSGTSGWPALEPHSPERMDPRGARLCSPPAWQGHCHLLAPSRQPSTASLPQSASLPPGEEPAPRPGGGQRCLPVPGSRPLLGCWAAGGTGMTQSLGPTAAGQTEPRARSAFLEGRSAGAAVGSGGRGVGGDHREKAARGRGEGSQGDLQKPRPS